VSKSSAGAFVNTCKGVLYQHFILSTNKINSMNSLHNACIINLLIPFIRDVTYKRLVEAEGTGSTFPLKCLNFYTPNMSSRKISVIIYTPVRT